jgi:integrase
VEVFGAVTTSNLPRGVYLRGNVYWITWRDLQGKRHREPAGTVLRDAVTARELRMADRHNVRFNIARKAPTLAQFVDEHYRVEVMPGLKPSTREGYETLLKMHLLPDLGNTKLSDITRARIRSFIAARGKLAPNTIRNAVALLSGILTHAVRDHEMLPANPAIGMLDPKYYPSAHAWEAGRPRFLEPLPFVQAVAKLDGADRDAVLFAALTGLSWQEQAGLKPGDISMQTNKLHVQRGLWRGQEQTLKSRNRVRTVDMTPTVRRIVSSLQHTHGTYLFGDMDRPLARRWKRASGLRWHDLRHQFAVLNIMAGKHPRWIQAQMGHGDIRLTMNVYGGLMETIAVAHVEWIDDLLPKIQLNDVQRSTACVQNVTAAAPQTASSVETVKLAP